jgi:hypothetical protein
MTFAVSSYLSSVLKRCALAVEHGSVFGVYVTDTNRDQPSVHAVVK